MLHIEAKAAWDAGATEAEMAADPAAHPERAVALGLDCRLARRAVPLAAWRAARLLAPRSSWRATRASSSRPSWAGSACSSRCRCRSGTRPRCRLHRAGHGSQPRTEGCVPRRHSACLVPVGGPRAAGPDGLRAPRPHGEPEGLKQAAAVVSGGRGARISPDPSHPLSGAGRELAGAEIIISNLLSPIVLAFVLGMAAALLRSDLEFPRRCTTR
jgi:hypothetical protein